VNATMPEPSELDPEPLAYLTKQQACDRMQVSESVLERAMKNGTLRFIGGGHGVPVRFRPEWLDEWYYRRGRGRG